MYIAVAADGKKLENEVSKAFESCEYLLIVNMSDMSVNAVKNEDHSSVENLAKKVVDFDCEAIITGELNPTVFNILAGACITRYFGFGHSTLKALELMEKNLLKLIRNQEGTDEYDGEHHNS
mgnify:CR=1 FL=1